jgi:hypothetical protein
MIIRYIVAIVITTSLACKTTYSSHSPEFALQHRTIHSLQKLCIAIVTKTTSELSLHKDSCPDTTTFLNALSTLPCNERIKKSLITSQQNLYNFVPPVKIPFDASHLFPGNKDFYRDVCRIFRENEDFYRDVCRINKSTLASASDAGIILWDIETKKAIHTFLTASSISQIVKFNNQFLFAGSTQHSVHLLDINSLQQVQVFENVAQIRRDQNDFDNNIFILFKNGSCNTFHIPTLKYTKIIPAHTFRAQLLENLQPLNMTPTEIHNFMDRILNISTVNLDDLSQAKKSTVPYDISQKLDPLSTIKIHKTLYAQNNVDNITLWHWDFDQLTIAQLTTVIKAANAAQEVANTGELPPLCVKYNLAKEAIERFDGSNDFECKYKNLIEHFAANPYAYKKNSSKPSFCTIS